MFTIEDITSAHAKVHSGADFPQYIRDLKALGIRAFEVRTLDSQTHYYGDNEYTLVWKSQYEPLTLETILDKNAFERWLREHQQGKTNYLVFCQLCARTGVHGWKVSLEAMTCTYYDNSGNEVLVEDVPE